MEKPETNLSTSDKEKKPEYSTISLIITFLLGIALIVFLQFAASDITKIFYGERPKTPDFSQGGRQGAYYQGKLYEDYSEAREAFEKAELLPYETVSLVVNTLVNVPLFLLAIALTLSLGKIKPAYKLTTTAFFIAMVVNMFSLLKDLGIYIYKINERLAIYGISLFLIIIFTGSIIYVQGKFRANASSAPKP